MKYYYWSVVILLMSSGVSYGQTNWEERINLGSTSENFSVARDEKGHYFVTGLESGKTPILAKITNMGSVEWVKQFSADGILSMIPNTLLISSDGGLVMGLTISIDGLYWPQSILLKCDSSGIPQWASQFPAPTLSYGFLISSVIETEDHGYAMINQFKGEQGTFEGVVTKLDSTGALKWSTQISDTGKYITQILQSKITKTIEGSLIVAGTEITSKDSAAAVRIIKLTSSGSPIWQKRISFSGTISVTSLAPTTDSGVAVCGRCGSDFYTAKFDQSGSLKWNKITNLFQDEEALAIAEMVNEDIIVAGKTSNFPPFGLSLDPAFVKDSLLIARFTSDGLLRSVQMFNLPFVSTIGQSIVRTLDDQSVIAGEIKDTTSSRKDLLLMKIGDINTDCHLRNMLVILNNSDTVESITARVTPKEVSFNRIIVNVAEELSGSSIDLCTLAIPASSDPDRTVSASLFPNPLHTITSLSLHITSGIHPGWYSLSLRNILGAETHRETIYIMGTEQDIAIHQGDMPAGIYYVTIQSDDNKIIWRGKIVTE